jgi:hypothetical protein
MQFNYYKDGIAYPITPTDIRKMNVHNRQDRQILMQLQRRYPLSASIAQATRGISMLSGNLILEVLK